MTILDNGMELTVLDESGVKQLDREVLWSLVKCYVKVFNDSWKEGWTFQNALTFITKSLEVTERRKPILSLLFQNGKVAGFSWLVLADRDNIVLDDMPLGLEKDQREYSKNVVQFWCDLAKINKVIIFRDLGVETGLRKSFRNKQLGSLLEWSVVNEAVQRGYVLMFCWTSTKSPIFKVALGHGNHPICFFPKEDRVVLKGNAIVISDQIKKLLEDGRGTLRDMIRINKEYFCHL